MATSAWRAMRLATVGCAAIGLMTACYAPPRAAPAPPGGTTQRATSTLPSASAAPATTTPTGTATASQSPSAASLATQRLAVIARRYPAGAISVAALNTHAGARYAWGVHGGMWTGSVYKLFVLEALLLERQRSGGWLNWSELADSTAMIEQSDNAAGYRMYLDVGGSSGLAAAARRLGLRHTRIGRADPALTTMGAWDGVTLLRHLVDDGPLTERSKRFALSLMRNVEADQRWGVGVVADEGSTIAIKNGWMQVDNDNGVGEDDDGRWLVDSLGIVQVRGQQVLMAVFTRHDPDYDTGIDLVQKVAKAVAPAVAARS